MQLGGARCCAVDYLFFVRRYGERRVLERRLRMGVVGETRRFVDRVAQVRAA